MKKISFLLVAFATMLLMSCSKGTPEEQVIKLTKNTTEQVQKANSFEEMFSIVSDWQKEALSIAEKIELDERGEIKDKEAVKELIEVQDELYQSIKKRGKELNLSDAQIWDVSSLVES